MWPRCSGRESEPPVVGVRVRPGLGIATARIASIGSDQGKLEAHHV